MIDFIYNLLPYDYVIYDVETYPNCFTFAAINYRTRQRYLFEISDRRTDFINLKNFITNASNLKCKFVGFNNLHFDYPVVHDLLNKFDDEWYDVSSIYAKAMSIINSDYNNRFAHVIWESDWIFDQVDLLKIHHFDNQARTTSLKMLEFNMRMSNIEDLPFSVGSTLDNVQKDTLIEYNFHDCEATVLFLEHSQDKIKFRNELTNRYNINHTNFNDTKIGKNFFIRELEKVKPGSCYRVVDGRKKMVQTERDVIIVRDIIFSYINFQNSEFNRILSWFKDQEIKETKGSINNVNCTVKGFQFDFGTGGIHGSLKNKEVHSSGTHKIIDIDVKSYYPNIAIKNGLYPAHLSDTFCHVYENLYNQRITAQLNKEDGISAMLKLALNGVYGDSNSKYSPFYDPQYTMSITINGQLLLCMLAEALLRSDDVDLIQINTDGLTIRTPKNLESWVMQVCKWWESVTQLTLEYADYQSMYIRDVNNYIAVYDDGKCKLKGAYEYDNLDWNKNFSAFAVKKAAEAYLVHGHDIDGFIYNHTDVYDFMLRAKVNRGSSLELDDTPIGNIARYYISNDGGKLEKVMPPAGPIGAYKRANKLTDEYYNAVLAEVGDAWDERIHTKNKSIYEERRTEIESGWKVTVCNNMQGVDVFDNINYDWYIKQTEKLVQMKE